MAGMNISGVDQAIETIINMEQSTIEEVKPLIREAAVVAKRKSAELAPTVTRANGKTYKPKLPRAIRRRSTEGGMTHTIDINGAKAPHGYMVNAQANENVKTPWRKGNRLRMGRQGGFIEAGGDAAEEFLNDKMGPSSDVY